MGPDARRQILLGVLAAVLALTVAYAVRSRPTAAPASTSNETGTTRGGSGTPSVAAAATTAPDVHLSALTEQRPGLIGVERNLFRFKPKVLPPPPSPVSGPVLRPGEPGGPPAAPSGPPPPPPIALKFIGIVEAREHGQKIAVLSDGRTVFHGREGDIIDGRYRIVRIGAESIELTYVDGRGRQTIRLTG